MSEVKAGSVVYYACGKKYVKTEVKSVKKSGSYYILELEFENDFNNRKSIASLSSMFGKFLFLNEQDINRPLSELHYSELKFICSESPKYSVPPEPEIKKKAEKGLLDIIREYYPVFEGPVHATELDNAISIIKTRKLYSRKAIKELKADFIDRADLDVITSTDINNPFIEECVRFYFRPGTPTHYAANYKRPVLLVFNPEIFKLDNAVFFSQTPAGKKMKPRTIEESIGFDWETILSRGPYDRTKNSIKQKRNAEFCVHGEYVSTDYLLKVYFRSEEDRNECIKATSNSSIFKVNKDIFDNFQ